MGVGTHFFVYDAVVSHFSRSSNVTADVTCKHCFMALCSCVTESERLHRNSGLEQGWPVSTSVKPLRQTHHPPAFDVCKNGCIHRNDQRVLLDPVERCKGGSSYAWEGASLRILFFTYQYIIIQPSKSLLENLYNALHLDSVGCK